MTLSMENNTRWATAYAAQFSLSAKQSGGEVGNRVLYLLGSVHDERFQRQRDL